MNLPCLISNSGMIIPEKILHVYGSYGDLMRLTLAIFPILLALFALAPLAADVDQAKKIISHSLNNAFPDIGISGIRESRIEGMYEVMLGAEVIYVSEDGELLFQGNLLDIKSHRNLTEERRATARVDLLQSVPTSEMIEFAPEDPKHSVYVFTDITCGFCQRLHKDIPELNKMGIAVRYLAFPRQGLGSPNSKDMESVWCAKDPNNAITNAKSGGNIKLVNCDNPVARHYNLGQDIGVRGTPAIFSESGEQIGGYLPPDEMIEALN